MGNFLFQRSFFWPTGVTREVLIFDLHPPLLRKKSLLWSWNQPKHIITFGPNNYFFGGNFFKMNTKLHYWYRFPSLYVAGRYVRILWLTHELAYNKTKTNAKAGDLLMPFLTTDKLLCKKVHIWWSRTAVYFSHTFILGTLTPNSFW